MNKEYTEVSIDLITPYWRNPRDNTKAVDMVKKSIQAYGYIAPIVVDKDMVIVAGHTRYKALKELGYKQVDVIVVDMDKKKAKEYRIIDNKSSEFAVWTDNLIPELKEFVDPDIIKEFFPEIKLDEMAELGSLSVSDQDIDKSNEDLDQHFKSIQDAKMNALLNLTCPHCGKDFSMSRNDILENPGMLKNDNG